MSARGMSVNEGPPMARRLRRRLIVSLAALSVLAVPPAAEGATFWTIRPDVRKPLRVGLKASPNGNLAFPVLAVPKAGARDQHWRIVRSTYGYRLANRQTVGECLGGGVADGGSKFRGTTVVGPCNAPSGRYGIRHFTFNRPGRAPTRTVTDGVVYQIRGTSREANGEEAFGRCLVVRNSFFQPRNDLVMEPCNRGTANQRFLLESFTYP